MHVTVNLQYTFYKCNAHFTYYINIGNIECILGFEFPKSGVYIILDEIKIQESIGKKYYD